MHNSSILKVKKLQKNLKLVKCVLIIVASRFFFEGDEYIIANSPYIVSNISILVYKPPKSNSLKNTSFNQYLVEIKIKVEYGIRCLKGKFQCLRRLNICIGSTQDHI